MNKKIDKVLAKLIADFKFDCDDVDWVLDFYNDEIRKTRRKIVKICREGLNQKWNLNP